MFFKRFKEDTGAFLARDPAATSRFEVALCYPGYHALVFHRASRALWTRGWRLAGRFLSNMGKFLTSIEIHPGAEIGRRLVIDHGAGVVIGETSVIGDDVTLYQAVTLGGIAPAVASREQASRKRHPTISDGAIIGSGAQILGAITIGEGARVGSNAVVTRDVPKGTTAVGVPARVILPSSREQAGEFVPYATPADGSPDPVLQTINGLRWQVTALAERIRELEGRLGEDDRQGGDEKISAIASNGH